ncbi:hypothetical protein [Paraburkholderia youngii]|uniref:hypothetical protein n=1 Tax=Paraburkholderia youngii TaxID=2782701 RepID=UPI0015927754|nr:hypothetical protein [Paraburkholderia youngii]NUX55910.1 hypothetical protein [Paraburkholderia youngii]
MTRYAIQNDDGTFTIDSIGQLYPNVSFAGGVPSASWLADNGVYAVADDLQIDALTQPVEVEPYLDGDVVRTVRPDPVTDFEAITNAYIGALQQEMDAAARRHGYDDIKSGITYLESSIRKFAAEAHAMHKWRDAVWTYGMTELEAVRGGEKPLPPLDEFIAAMPQIQWPGEEVST